MYFNGTGIWGGETICSENFHLNQIQNGRLSAIINLNMPDSEQTVPDR